MSAGFAQTVLQCHWSLACEQALSVWGKDEKIARRGKGGELVEKHLGPPFHGTCCASDPDAAVHQILIQAPVGENTDC